MIKRAFTIFLILIISSSSQGSVDSPTVFSSLMSLVKGEEKPAAGIQAEHKNLRSVLFFSGVVLAGSAETTGGWGDVASNFNGALNFKKLYPELKVTFIVLNEETKFNTFNGKEYEIATPQNIVGHLAKGTDSKVKNKIQKFKGVDVVYLDFSLEDLAKGRIKNKELDKLHELIGTSDLRVGFSENNTSYYNHRTFRRFAKFYISLSELNYQATSHEKPVYSLKYKKGQTNVLMNPRGGDIGYYLNSDLVNDPNLGAKSLEFINKKLSKDLGLTFTSETEIGLAVSKLASSAQLYIDASVLLAENNPSKKYAIFVQGLDGLKVDHSLANLKIIVFKNYEEKLYSSIVSATTLPPMVHGDSVVSQILSTAHVNNRFLIYLEHAWKDQMMSELVQSFSWEAIEGLDESLLELYPESIEEMSEARRSILPLQLYKYMEDKALQKRVVTEFLMIRPMLNVYTNIYNYYDRFHSVLNEMSRSGGINSRVLNKLYLESLNYPESKSYFNDLEKSVSDQLLSEEGLKSESYLFRFYLLIKNNKLSSTKEISKHVMYINNSSNELLKTKLSDIILINIDEKWVDRLVKSDPKVAGLIEASVKQKPMTKRLRVSDALKKLKTKSPKKLIGRQCNKLI